MVKKQQTIHQNLPKIVQISSAGGGFRRFGSVWGDLGASLSILGASWERLWASWGHLGAVLGASLAILGRLEASWGVWSSIFIRFYPGYHFVPDL